MGRNLGAGVAPFWNYVTLFGPNVANEAGRLRGWRQGRGSRSPGIYGGRPGAGSAARGAGRTGLGPAAWKRSLCASRLIMNHKRHTANSLSMEPLSLCFVAAGVQHCAWIYIPVCNRRPFHFLKGTALQHVEHGRHGSICSSMPDQGWWPLSQNYIL